MIVRALARASGVFAAVLGLLVGLVVSTPPAFAQGDAGAQPGAGAAVWEPFSASWTDAAFGPIAEKLIGTWRTVSEVESVGGDEVDLILNIHAVPVAGLSDALYMETFRADDLVNPSRQVIGQLYRHTGAGEIRLRTFEIRTNELSRGVFAGMGLVPRAFPEVEPENLIATLDLAFTESGETLAARTPHKYPTGVGGAVEMTSALELAGGRLRTMDRGYGADGRRVWGPAEGEAYEFERADDLFGVSDLGEGLIAIDFNDPAGELFNADDVLYAHYTGWLRNAAVFDSSYQRGEPLRIAFPPQLIAGWNVGLAGVTEGRVRKLIIPSDLAYGPQGRGGIPPNAPLYFIVEVVAIDRGEEGGAGAGDGD